MIKRIRHTKIENIQPSTIWLDEYLVCSFLKKSNSELFKDKIRIGFINNAPFRYYSLDNNEKLFVLYKSGIETLQLDIIEGSFEPYISEAFRAYENKIHSFKDLENKIVGERDWYVKNILPKK